MANYDNFLAIFIFLTLFVSDILCMIALSKETYQTSPGQVLAITCRDKSGQTVFWKGLKGEKLGPTTRPSAESRSFGKLLVFQHTKIEDSGEYVCHSKDLRETKIFTLSVEEPIEIECPSEIIGLEGQDVKVACKIKNKKKYSTTFTWNIEGYSLVGDPDKYKFDGDTLVIKNVSKDDNGLVVETQIISTKDGSRHYRNTTIIVYHGPYPVFDENEIQMAYDPVYKAYEEEFNLTCKVEANPAPTFKWFKDNRSSKKFIMETPYISIYPIVMSETTVGVYKCKAQNEHGEHNRLYDVRLGRYPDPPLWIEVAGNTSETLELNITLPDPEDDGMDPNILVIEYRELGEQSWFAVEYELNNTVIIPMETLQTGTTYEFRAATKNILGMSEFTNSTTFETSFAISVHSNYMQILVSLFILIISLT